MVLWWSRKKSPDLLLAGVSNLNDDYPNVSYKVAWLLETEDYHVESCIHNLARRDSFWSASSSRSIWRTLALFARIAVATLGAFFATLRSGAPRVYIVYPSLPLAVCLMVWPRRWRPEIVLDGFISLYDTLVNDRRLLSPDSWMARRLFSLERFSFARAETVIVDTQENANFYQQLFDLPIERFAVVPLAIPSQLHASINPVPADEPLRVVFFGSLVPLQGIATILEAITQLQNEHWVNFELIGDGQQANLVEAAVANGLDNLVWHRQWLPTSDLEQRIEQAHLALGVFATAEKTARVVPYKIYYYLSKGRPCITARTAAIEGLAADDGNDSALTLIEPGSAAQLIAAIRSFNAGRDSLPLLQQRAREKFDAKLSSARWQSKMREILLAS